MTPSAYLREYWPAILIIMWVLYATFRVGVSAGYSQGFYEGAMYNKLSSGLGKKEDGGVELP